MRIIGYIACFFVLLVIDSSCQKPQADTVVPDHFVFGYNGMMGFAYGKYELNNGQIFPSDTASPAGTLNFLSTPLADSKYLLAQPLSQNIPAYFWSHPNQSFGCAGCADGPAFYVEAIRNGQKTYWYMDANPAGLPVEIQAYITQIGAVLKQLP
jgi:hypothetical protein